LLAVCSDLPLDLGAEKGGMKFDREDIKVFIKGYIKVYIKVSSKKVRPLGCALPRAGIRRERRIMKAADLYLEALREAAGLKKQRDRTHLRLVSARLCPSQPDRKSLARLRVVDGGRKPPNI
jgi:hypothetical protein